VLCFRRTWNAATKSTSCPLAAVALVLLCLLVLKPWVSSASGKWATKAPSPSTSHPYSPKGACLCLTTSPSVAKHWAQYTPGVLLVKSKIYTPPSICYSELEVYTERRFAQGQRVRVVLQYQQQPNYETCGETAGWNRK
jgi:hypothetical protein